MTVTTPIVYLFTILVPFAIVFSQDVHSVPSIPRIPGLSHLPGFPSGDSENPIDGQDVQSRFFINIPRYTSCNYTSEPGRTCRSCNEALTCLSRNVGFLTTCRGIFPYCNEGRCSLYQGSDCTNSTG